MINFTSCNSKSTVSCLTPFALGFMFISQTNAIDIQGSALALASRNGEEDRQTIDLSTSSNPTGSVSAVFLGASAQVEITLTDNAAISSVSVEHTIDTGPTPVGSGATDGAFTFSAQAGSTYEFTGFLETITTIPSIGPVVRIRTLPSGTIIYQATPNLQLPNRPVDFNEILSTGTFFSDGMYELSWVHIANYTTSSAPTVGHGNFTFTITSPGCNAADINADGTLNFFDVSAFLNAFSMMDPSADINNNGTWNFFDVSEFLSIFADGCP